MAVSITSQAGLDRQIKAVCDILRRDKAKGARLYVPELTWMIFLNALDIKEADEARKAAAVGATFTPTIASPYRWRDWAAPPSAVEQPAFTAPGFKPGWKRKELAED